MRETRSKEMIHLLQLYYIFIPMLDKPGGMVYHTDRPRRRAVPVIMNDMEVQL